MGTILSLIGITLDIIGAWLLFNNGFSADMYKILTKSVEKLEKGTELWKTTNEAKNRVSGKSNLGFKCLIAGFAFQFLGTLFPAIIPGNPKINRERECKCDCCNCRNYPPVAYINYKYSKQN